MVERHRPRRLGQRAAEFELRIVGQQRAGQHRRRRRALALHHHARGGAHHVVRRLVQDAPAGGGDLRHVALRVHLREQHQRAPDRPHRSAGRARRTAARSRRAGRPPARRRTAGRPRRWQTRCAPARRGRRSSAPSCADRAPPRAPPARSGRARRGCAAAHHRRSRNASNCGRSLRIGFIALVSTSASKPRDSTSSQHAR